MKYISPDIYFKDNERTINYGINSDHYDIPVIADQIAEVFEKFILFFSPYTYGKEMDSISIKPKIGN